MRHACWLAGLLATVASGAACGRDALDREALLDPTTCASCHPDQYAEWSRSMHAYASDDPVFLALDALGQEATGGALRTLCVGCHAPTAVAEGVATTGAEVAAAPRALRGVGCWACHAIDGVTALHNGGLRWADDRVMRGGIAAPVDTPAHGSRRDHLLAGDRIESSDPCGACHDVRVGDAAVEATYAEWAGSLFGPGGVSPVSCAGCHMFGRDAPAAALPGMPTRRVHDHAFPAIDRPLTSWPGQAELTAGIARDLAPAVSLRLCVLPAAGGVDVEVTLDNLQVGHAFPSGVTHSRRVWVEAVATAGDRELFATGRFAPDQAPTADADPALWRLGTHFFDAGGREVDFAWEVASVTSELLTPSVTNDPNDPNFYHARSHHYPVLGAPDRVDAVVHVEPIGLELLDKLIAAGALAPEVRARMPRWTISSTARTWRRADGFGCAP